MILDEIVHDKKKRLLEHKSRISPQKMKEEALSCTRKPVSFYESLAKPGLSIIGEFKKASPSMGVIEQKIDLTDRIGQYNASADAISCLTEEDHFHGNVEYLKQIRKISALPILRKDFVVDEYQIYEARAVGADAILLIAAILDDGQLKHFYDLGRSMGLGVLTEVHDEAEMERTLKLDADIIGINNRNLKDFSISLKTTGRLAKMVPDGRLLVSESGVSTEDDIRYLKECSVHALLVGRAFMESENPGMLAARWKEIYLGHEG